ncbi:MAG: hypothetical protein M1820_005405 [Bogoriella megaspora]|nr:MAG: hypothetical protein M1820_005405 [Bogoriella megaspora]
MILDEANDAKPPHASTGDVTFPKDEIAKDDSIINLEAATEQSHKAQGAPGDSKKKPSEATLVNFWRMLCYATPFEWGLIISGIITSAGAGIAFPLLNVVVFGHLTASFTEYFTPGSTISKHDFLAQVNHNALYIIYLFVGKFVLGYVSTFAFRMSGIRISASIRHAYLSALFAQPISVIDKLPGGSAADSLTTAANTIQMAISDKLSALIQSIVLLVAAYIVAFIWSWQLTLASSSCILFVIVVYGILLPFFLKVYKSILKENAAAAGIAGEAFQSIRTVKALCAEGAMLVRHGKRISEARRLGNRLSPLTAAQFAPAFFAIYANTALTFWFGIKLYREGHIDNVGSVLTVLFSVLLVVSAFEGIFAPIQNIFKAAAASGPLFKAIDAPRRPTEGAKDNEVDGSGNIEFQDVEFAYPSRPQTAVLKGLSLSIPSGKITALVGPSGCGKSTIVGLLERWYQLSDVNTSLVEESKEATPDAKPNKNKKAKKGKAKGSTSDTDVESKHAEAKSEASTAQSNGPVLQNTGSIIFGSHNIEQLDLRWWRSHIGLVQQEPFLFNKSVFENVAFGLIGTEWEHASLDHKKKLVQTACEEAFANEFIQRLPQQYDTMVGESGIKLSGGQRQRIAIARSIVKQPAILILDEATSAIDVRGERLVQAALDRVSKGRTTITIAHRLSTIKKADQIVVLKDGHAVENGTHEELLSRPDGAYFELVRAQNLNLGSEEDNQLTGELTKVESNKLLNEDLEAIQSATQAEKPKEKRKLKHGFFGSVGRLLYEQRRNYLIYALILISVGICGAIYALQSFLTSHLVTVFQYTGQKLTDRGNFWSLMFFIVAIVSLFAYGTLGLGTNMISVQLSSHYRQEYFQTILNKPIEFYDEEGHSSGVLTSQISNDPQQIQETLGPNLAFPLIGLFNMIACIIIAFVFGWKLTLVSISILPVLLGAAYFRLRFELVFESYNAKVFAESSDFGAEAIRAFRTVTSLTMEDHILNRYHELLQDHVNKAFRKSLYAMLTFSLSDSTPILCITLCFWYGAQLLATREYDVMKFFLVFTAVVQNGQQAGFLLAFGANFANATAAANRILAARGGSEFESAEGTEAATSQAEAKAFEAEGKRRGMSIDISNADFQYPTRDVRVFRGLEVGIKPNEYVAFVGPSGCGKSTIISLLSRFYALSSGSLRIDGIEATDWPLTKYRSDVALVSQEPTLFEGTIRENLILGLPHADTITDEEIAEACEAAQIHTFIASLPQGYGTHLTAGTHASLSGGQKQRVCIARALLRKPRLLLLDEATSSLDSQNEGLVQAVIERVARAGDVTVVVVAHRLATVQNVDRIIVLGDGGKILEEGTHGELLSRRGVYWGMCQAQALDR